MSLPQQTHLLDTQLTRSVFFNYTTQDTLGVSQVCFPMDKHSPLLHVVSLFTSPHFPKPATVRGTHCATDHMWKEV